ncbi:M28 family peptidase [Filimonas effusa]|uniref:M28 family peptidase n=1 Tax=Filimonas effusa TaxID=2508721 RepID=A0A4Q1DEQ4_9BACT|nr:M28 family peptidase [Filimonas effusa]
MDTLTSRCFEGRGYTHDGMNKAACFIQDRFKEMGLQPLAGKQYQQSFSYPVNTFPGRASLFINGVQLVAGRDFIPSPESAGVKGAGKLVQKDATHFIDLQNRIVVDVQKKLTWSVAPQAADYTVIQVDSVSFSKVGKPETIEIDLENKLVSRFKAANVCAMVKGSVYPDSVILLTAHYDHLGGLGTEAYFPGANDNASGVALLLSLAQYYSKHPQPYSIGFICFAGEEAGLLGSNYYTQHPLLPLKQIRFLLNMDMVGTGEDGITVVNATEFPDAFASLQQLNKDKKYLADVKSRGKAANSDHYPFSEKGVPAFFMYTLGGIRAYHDVFDVASTLPMQEFSDLGGLIKDFFAYLQSGAAAN